jgi:hypothetical protein
MMMQVGGRDGVSDGTAWVRTESRVGRDAEASSSAVAWRDSATVSGQQAELLIYPSVYGALRQEP